MSIQVDLSHANHSMTPIIETNNLTKRFGSHTAVQSVNLTIHKGEVFGLLGPNGAGKTTFLSMLCTILRPTSGSALINGYDIISDHANVRKSIGIVFQDPSVDTDMTSRENLQMHADLYGMMSSSITPVRISSGKRYGNEPVG